MHKAEYFPGMTAMKKISINMIRQECFVVALVKEALWKNKVPGETEKA